MMESPRNPGRFSYRAADFGYSAYNAILYIGVDRRENWYVFDFDGIYQEGLDNTRTGGADS
jgi:hypothetical protein